ncbi:MAG TPA: DUF4010 domain-containing protein [Allosphingosinicella sp.]|nr:DUF4010 domain-containing protein [Allosphingosinicella sp.]
MDEFELFRRMGLAIAIGAMIGVERHWREREADRGQRTAGLRTFTLIGLFGGLAALIELDLAGGAQPNGAVFATLFAVLALAVTAFEYRQAAAEGSFSATTTVAAMLTFALGALAVAGSTAIASAGAVVLLAVLASRELLHGFVRRLSWPELRSAVILLAFTFVLLPVIPDQPYGPFGGVSPARTVTLVIVLASISYAGYIAVKLLGSTRGEIVAGAVGGLVSSTAVTVTNARRSKDETAHMALASGAIAAGAISFVRTALLAATLAPPLAPVLLPALGAGAAVLLVYAVILARRGGSEHVEQAQKNPFDLGSVIKMALMLVVISFLARAAGQMFGSSGVLVVSGLSGLADVDAAVVAVTSMMGSITVQIGALAIALAVLVNAVAKASYATALGVRGFFVHMWLASIAAAAALGAGLWFSLPG